MSTGVVDQLNREINAGLADAKLKARLEELGSVSVRCFARGIRQAPRRAG
jgi:hypothetical protein